MKYRDLRDFIQRLEDIGELKRVSEPVDPVLEMTEICDRVLRKGGPAILFENPITKKTNSSTHNESMSIIVMPTR